MVGVVVAVVIVVIVVATVVTVTVEVDVTVVCVVVVVCQHLTTIPFESVKVVTPSTSSSNNASPLHLLIFATSMLFMSTRLNMLFTRSELVGAVNTSN